MKNNKGYFLIEALLSIVIFSTLILSLFSMISFLQRRTVRSAFESDAAVLLQDGMEVAHSVLLSDWGKVEEGVYYLSFDIDNNRWELVKGDGEMLEAIFNRKIAISKVCRETTNGERVDFVGVCSGPNRMIDQNSYEITTTISWRESDIPKEIEAELLVVNTSDK